MDLGGLETLETLATSSQVRRHDVCGRQAMTWGENGCPSINPGLGGIMPVQDPPGVGHALKFSASNRKGKDVLISKTKTNI